MSFQITILKVLAGSRGGCLPLADLRHDVALLISSGREWTDRTKRIAARAPDLDIFSQALVVREPMGWRITPTGRDFLATVEKPAASPVASEAAPFVFTVEAAPVVVDAPILALPVPLIGANMRRQRKRRGSTRAGRSAVA